MYFFQSARFLTILADRLSAYFLMSSGHIFVDLLGVLDPLRKFNIVDECTLRLWSCLTICPAHLNLDSCAACEAFSICVLYEIENINLVEDRILSNEENVSCLSKRTIYRIILKPRGRYDEDTEEIRFIRISRK